MSETLSFFDGSPILSVDRTNSGLKIKYTENGKNVTAIILSENKEVYGSFSLLAGKTEQELSDYRIGTAQGHYKVADRSFNNFPTLFLLTKEPARG